MAVVRFVVTTLDGLVVREGTATSRLANAEDIAWEVCAAQARNGQTVHVWLDPDTRVPAVRAWFVGVPVSDGSATAVGCSALGTHNVWTRVA